jgi:FAD:protein FMN transferase
MRTLALSLLALLSVAVWSACSDGTPAAAVGVQEFSGPTMGSTYTVKFVGKAALADVRAIVEHQLRQFDETFSTWRGDSEIQRVNAHDSTDPLPVSEVFASVLSLALEIAAATDGAFDPTVKPLSDLYRAHKRAPESKLDAIALRTAQALVGWQRITVVDRQVSKAQPDVDLDLDGLVAGACADAIAADLARLPLQGFYLDVTGEVLCRGDKGAGGPWQIGVVDPRADSGVERAFTTVALRDRALCTSGDYRNAVVVDGKLLHHVFDPRTGRNPDHRVVSASVLADSAAVADAFGTAFLVMGEDAVQKLWLSLKRRGLHGALLLTADRDGALAATQIDWPRAP